MKIAELKEQVGIDQVLTYLGAGVGYSGVWDRWVPVRCPFHNDRKPSGSMHRARGQFFCFSCDAPRDDGRAGDILDVAGRFLGTADKRRQIEWLTDTFLYRR